MADAAAERDVRHIDIVALVVDERRDVLNAVHDLAAGDGYLRLLSETADAVDIVVVQRLLKPQHAEIVQLLCRFECALIRPERDAPALKVSVAHGALIGIADDGHLIADGLTDILHDVDIFLYRRHEQAQLHGAEALVEQAERVLLPFLVAAQLAHGGVGRDMVTIAAHDFIRRQACLLTEDVPEGVLHDPRTRGEPSVALETGG